MDGVNRSSSSPSVQCVDGAVNAAAADTGCAAAVTAWAITSPTGVGAVVGGIASAVACFSAGWNTAKAVDQCTGDEPGPGTPPAYGKDGFDDHRDDPADAPWRSKVEIQPLGWNAEVPEDRRQEIMCHDSSD